MLSNAEIENLLNTLEIYNDISDVTLKEVNSAFQRLALLLHPDKAGEDSTEAFKTLRDSYEKIRDHFKAQSKINPNELDESQRFFNDKFEAFNFPFENKGSFTVKIEDSLADLWQKSLTSKHGIPKIRTNTKGTECDRYWKLKYKTTS